MKGKTILWTLVGVTILAAAYYGYKKMSSWTKQSALDYLEKVRGWDAKTKASASSFEAPFLIAYAKSNKAGEETFTYKGKTYSSATGRAV